jgi:hypothetical protein
VPGAVTMFESDSAWVRRKLRGGRTVPCRSFRRDRRSNFYSDRDVYRITLWASLRVLVPVDQRLVELGEDQLVLGTIREPLGCNDVGQVEWRRAKAVARGGKRYVADRMIGWGRWQASSGRSTG